MQRWEAQILCSIFQVSALLEYLFFLELFTFTSYILTQLSVLFYLLHFQNKLIASVLMPLRDVINHLRRFTDLVCRHLTSWKCDSTISYICGAFTDSSDKSCRFCLYVIFESYYKYISEPVLFHLYLS